MADPPMQGFVVSRDPPRFVKLYYCIVFSDCGFDLCAKVACRITTHGHLSVLRRASRGVGEAGVGSIVKANLLENLNVVDTPETGDQDRRDAVALELHLHIT